MTRSRVLLESPFGWRWYLGDRVSRQSLGLSEFRVPGRLPSLVLRTEEYTREELERFTVPVTDLLQFLGSAEGYAEYRDTHLVHHLGVADFLRARAEVVAAAREGGGGAVCGRGGGGAGGAAGGRGGGGAGGAVGGERAGPTGRRGRGRPLPEPRRVLALGADREIVVPAVTARGSFAGREVHFFPLLFLCLSWFCIACSDECSLTCSLLLSGPSLCTSWCKTWQTWCARRRWVICQRRVCERRGQSRERGRRGGGLEQREMLPLGCV